MKDYKLTKQLINGITYYYATFIDGQGITQTIELDEATYDVINESQKKISSQARKDRRYGLCSFDESIGENEIVHSDEQTEELLHVIRKNMQDLTEVQRRRLRLYLEEKKTFVQIAELEGTSYPAIRYCIVAAIQKLKSKKYF